MSSRGLKPSYKVLPSQDSLAHYREAVPQIYGVRWSSPKTVDEITNFGFVERSDDSLDDLELLLNLLPSLKVKQVAKIFEAGCNQNEGRLSEDVNIFFFAPARFFRIERHCQKTADRNNKN
ncbi:unnamed protein product [Auanema sp. JU1783]|nr:unnamed protein product [Auanema sp. JU1783]